MQIRFPMKVVGEIVNNIKELTELSEYCGEASNLLGDMFFDGYGAPKDVKKAIGFYEKGVSQGNTQAMMNMGFFYQKGIGVKQDIKAAEKMYLKAYKGGDSEAYAMLGQMYTFGMGPIKQDLKKGFDFYLEGCEKAPDDENLNRLLDEMGIGVSKFSVYYDQIFGEGADIGKIRQLEECVRKSRPTGDYADNKNNLRSRLMWGIRNLISR